MRLDKFLATAGFGSRKEIKELVRRGKVSVNGQGAGDPGMQVNPDADQVEVSGERVSFAEFVYLMLNKPAGYISATEDREKKTVIDLVPDQYRHYHLFPVGRLDKDTEGLLLLTNDGRLAHELLAPRKHIPKTYYVRTEGEITPDHADLFRRGVVLADGYQTMPAVLKILRAGEVSEAELTIYEGKFHQVKRMFRAVGLQVIYLKRRAMAGLELDESLSPGEMRPLTEAELELLKGPAK